MSSSNEPEKDDSLATKRQLWLIPALGWLSLLSGIACVVGGCEQGWMNANLGWIIGMFAGGLLALILGVLSIRRGAPLQGALQIIGGLILSGLPLLVILAIGAAYSGMAQGG